MVLAALIPFFLFLLLLFYCTVIGTGANFKSSVVSLPESIFIIGISSKSNPQSTLIDEKVLLDNYKTIDKKDSNLKIESPEKYISVSLTKSDTEKIIIIGNIISTPTDTIEGLSYFEIPALTYVTFNIKEKKWFSWTKAINQIENHIYLNWLPENGYEPDKSFLGEVKFYEKENNLKRILLYVAIKKIL